MPTESPAGAAIGAGVTILAALALATLRDVVDNANLALTMVLVIVLCGFFGGRWTGVGAAVGAALGFDFFLTQPYLHLRIDSSDDVVTTLLLLAIGLVVGQLAVIARKRQRTASERHTDVERVWRVAEMAARGSDPEDITSAVRAELLSLLRLADCTFDTATKPSLPVMGPQGNVANTQLRFRDGGFELPSGGFSIPVHIGDRLFGHLVCVPLPDVGISSDQRHVAVVLADQLGLAIAARTRPGATS